jgi:protein ImuB
MAFASIYIPDFCVQAVVRGEPALRGCGVALVDGVPQLCTVVAANEMARRAGIGLGIAKLQAEQFPGTQVRPRSRAQEEIAHAALLDLGWCISPRVEDTAPDTMVIDLAGLTSLFGPEETIAQLLFARAAALGFAAQIAVASRIEAAILASRGLPGINLISHGEEAQTLSPLPVRMLLPSLEILETLQRWGISTCGQLTALPVIQLSERLGQEGVRLYELARGSGSRSLVQAVPSIHFEESMELDESIEDLESLSFLLGRLLDQLFARLSARSLAARAIRLRFALQRPADIYRGEGAPRKRQDAPSSCYEQILTLPVPMRDSKLLLKLIRLRLKSDPPGAPIRQIVLSAGPDRPRTAQTGLFCALAPEPEKVELTVARLANLVGAANVGCAELVDTHRPDGTRMNRFLPAATGAVLQTIQRESGSSLPANGFRLFRPALPVRVTLRDGCPGLVFFRGAKGIVKSASGPWRSSGEWWQEEPWNHAEWDLEIEFTPIAKDFRKPVRNTVPNGVYRIFHDALQGRWLVSGVYD